MRLGRDETPCRAVIYARYSSDLQRDASIEDQVRTCRSRIEREGLTYVATYADHAIKSVLAVSAAPEPLIHPNLAEIYRQKVAALHEALADPTSRDEAFDTIRSLIEEIRLVPENGELRIEIRGELGGILSLCDASDRRKPGVGGRAVAAAEQIKMVAGTRNHLYRTRISQRQ